MDTQSIIDKGPDFILELVNNLGDDVVAIEKVNWSALADQCASKSANLLSSGELDEGKSWSYMVVKLYEYMAASSSNDSLALGFEISATRIKINAINTFGVSQDELLSVEKIEEWFQSRVAYSKDEALKKAENWTALPKDEIMLLRNIKNMLNAVELIKDTSCFSDEGEMVGWINIKNQLP